MKSEAVMAFVPQFLILLLTVGVALGQYKSCPPMPEDISPCTCGKEPFGEKEEVVCEKVDDVAQVRRALQSLRLMREVSVTFKFCSLGLVPSDLFKGLHITRLDFTHCNLKGIGNEGRSALEGLEDTVEAFWVVNLEGNELRSLNVTGLRKLERLYVRWNDMKELGNEWFAEGPTNLETLVVTGNGIERLGDRAFAHLANIRDLWIGHNKVRAPKRSMFPSPAVHLDTLVLVDNKISNLPDDMFLNMPALKHVHLDDNSLQHLPATTWTFVWSQLEILDLSGNPFICDSSVEWTLRQRRPGMLSGRCVAPEDRRGTHLWRMIDDRAETTTEVKNARCFLERTTENSSK